MLNINIFFNYFGRLYNILVAIVCLPMFIQYLGGESYGLIGFFLLVLAWMQLLDLGLNPTLGREVSRLKGKDIESRRLLLVVNSIETCFVVVALIAFLILFLFKEWIATYWLKVNLLPHDLVVNAVLIISIIVPLRLISSISRSGVNAYEAQVWLNIVDIIFNTIRYPGLLLIIMMLEEDVMVYFLIQLALTLCELIVIRWKFRKLLPERDSVEFFSIAELKRIAPFCLGIAYTASVWVVLTQFDKLLLSNVLSLEEFGYFTLVSTITTGLISLSFPVSRAILPRMTFLLSHGEKNEMVNIYRKSTRLVVSLIMPIVMVISLFSYDVLYAWTGDEAAAEYVAGILPMFSAGSGLLIVNAFQYYLQYAYGNLKYHVAYNTFSLFLNVPLILWATYNYGVEGAAWVWFGFRLLTFIFWVPVIHNKYEKGLHFVWLIKDLLPVFAVSLLCCLMFYYFDVMNYADNRILDIVFLGCVTLLSMLMSYSVSRVIKY